MRSNLNDVSITFDLDGTLIDTAPDLIRVLNSVIAEQGLQPARYDNIRAIIGLGSLAMINRAFFDQNIEISEIKARALQSQFFSRYERSLSQDSQPFPGVEETLAQLKRIGAKLSVCTNKPGRYARPLMRDLGLARYFDRIVGAEDTRANKPSAQHIFDSVGHRGNRPIIMVGDGAPDVLAARAAKVPVILMRYGYSAVPMDTFQADRILRNFRDLPSTCIDILH